MKLCECGCGQPAPISETTWAPYGWVKGEPKRFINGHNGRKVQKETKYYSKKNNYGVTRTVHSLRAEKALGHVLPKGAVVHHADGSKRDDAPLVICQDQAYHAALHGRMRIQERGGNPWTDVICMGCDRVLNRDKFSPGHHKLSSGTCRECCARKTREYRERKALQQCG